MNILKGVKDKIDVKVEVRSAGDCGTVALIHFVATFRTFTQPEREAFIEKYLGTAMTRPHELKKADAVRERLVDWKNFPTTEDRELPFDEESLELVLGAPDYVDGLWVALQSVAGGGAQIKN